MTLVMLPTQPAVWPFVQAATSAGCNTAFLASPSTMPDLRVIAHTTKAAVATASSAINTRRRRLMGR